MDWLKGAGIFIYPLLVCSIVVGYVILDRLFALRWKRILAKEENSTASRLRREAQEKKLDAEALEASARLEISHLESGLFILDIVVTAAPLLGLLGTVVGLIKVFSNISLETGIPESASMVSGIAMALSTTMIGLIIAIPALIASGYFNRKLDMYAARLELIIKEITS